MVPGKIHLAPDALPGEAFPVPRPPGTKLRPGDSYSQPSGMRSDVDFEALVREHHAALYRFALSMTRDEADACDLVQETFLRWAEKGHQLVDPTRVKTWLFTTLFREASAHRRRLLRFPQQTLDDAETELPDVPPVAAAATDGRLLLEALQQVDPTYRDAVALFYLENHTHPEIAEVLGIPLGTVKSRISRGVAQLQRLLLRTAGTPPTPPP